MSLALIRLFLGAALKSVIAWLSHRSFWQLAFMAALLLAGWEYIGKRTEQRHASKVESQLSKSEAARKADHDTYTKAQAEAAAKNKAQVAHVEQQYQRNSDDERQGYLDDLARLRGLRAKAPASPAGATIAPAPVSPAAGADANGLPLPADEHLQASEIELRLMHLQNWVEMQLNVDPNAP